MNASFSSESGDHSMSSGDFFINIAFSIHTMVPGKYLLRPFRPVLRRFGVNVEAGAAIYVVGIMRMIFVGLFYFHPLGIQSNESTNFFLSILLFQTMSLVYPNRATLTGPIDSEDTDFGRCPRLRAIFHGSSVLWMLFNSDPGLKRFVPDGVFAYDGNDWQWYGLCLLILYRSFDFIQMAICKKIVCRTSGMMLRTAGIYALLSADHRLMTTSDPKNHDETAELYYLIFASLCIKSVYDFSKIDCVRKAVEIGGKPQNIFTMGVCGMLFLGGCFTYSSSPFLLIFLSILMHLVIAVAIDKLKYISSVGYYLIERQSLGIWSMLTDDFDYINSMRYCLFDRRSLRIWSRLNAMLLKLFVGAVLAWMCVHQGVSYLRIATTGVILGLVLKDIRKLFEKCNSKLQA